MVATHLENIFLTVSGTAKTIIFFQVSKFKRKATTSDPCLCPPLGATLCMWVCIYIPGMSEAVVEDNSTSVHEGLVKLDN